MPPAAAAPAFMAFDALKTRVLQGIAMSGCGGFGPLQHSLAPLPIAKGGLGITTTTSPLPCAHLASITQAASLQTSILEHPLPLLLLALAARADCCALVPELDAALLEDPDFVRGKFQA